MTVVDSPDRLASAFARQVERAAAAAIEVRGKFSCALPGGSAATVFLPALVDAAVDWPRVHVFWVDERAVPPQDETSNFGLASRLWLEHLGVGRPNVHRMHGESPNLDSAAADYASVLTRTLGTPPRLDLILLGVGADGHVASLFSGHPALDERERFVVAVRDAPKPPPARLTLTMPALLAARAICVAAFEAEKAHVIRTALEAEGPAPLPIARVLKGSAPVTLMVTTSVSELLASNF